MDTLRQQLETLMSGLENHEDFLDQIENLFSVYPFNEFEYIISTLLGLGKLKLDDYYDLRNEYIARNMYLYLFEMSAPRGFGETWAQGHLKELVPELIKPTRKIDPNYSAQYDFLLRRIRIEVKASRAVDSNSKEALYVKALSSSSAKPFDMNFQQIKPACCDVFIWVAVWRDIIRYWVLASIEVEQNPFYSPGQHRGNIGEGQLHMTRDNIESFAKYEARPNQLGEAILAAYERQNDDTSQ